MRQNVFLLDGKAYNVNVMELKRKFAITDTDQSGRVANYRMFRDIVGTFYNYSLKVAPAVGDPESYDSFYDDLTDPTPEYRKMTFPYGQEQLEFEAYVTQGEDDLRIRNGVNYWGGKDGLKLEFVAMEPQRRR